MQPTELIEVIGVEAARKLCAVCGGGPIYIPQEHRFNTMVERNSGMMHDLDSGMSIAQVARKWGTATRTVRRVQALFLEHRRL